MATTSYSAASSATPNLAVQATEVVADSVISQLIPYAYTAFELAFSLLSFSLTVLKLVLSPLPILLYIIAPLTTFIDVTTTVLIRVPYRTSLYVADALYPLYVFFGVACITGCLFGYGGRLIVLSIVGEQPVGPSKSVEEKKKDTKSRGRQAVKFEE